MFSSLLRPLFGLLLPTFLYLLSSLWATPISAQGLVPVPALTARVIDQTHTLDHAQAQLESQLAQIEAQRGSQIVVLMVPSTRGEDIAAFAHRVASTWKIGRKEVGDGVLIVAAIEDRKIRIEVARALEGTIPDLMAYRIIEEHIKPAFRQGNYAQGLGAALQAMDTLLAGEFLPAPTHDYSDPSAQGDSLLDSLFPLLFFAIFFVPALAGILRKALGRSLGSIATAGLGAGFTYLVSSSLALALSAGLLFFMLALFAGLIPSSLTNSAWRRSRDFRGLDNMGGWGSGGWGGMSGSGGTGFGSGGGGSFGGGGASGSW